MDMRLRGSFKDYKDSYENSRIQVFYKEILDQYHPVSSSFVSNNKCLNLLSGSSSRLKISYAQKKFKKAFENADSS
nr:hypothetical protein [Tanacetum cinerariifolium]